MQRVFSPLLIALALLATPEGSRGQEFFQQFVHYTMRVQLDTDARRVTGDETIAYTNNSPDTLDAIYLHLYPNAYESKDTEFMRHWRRRFNYNLFNHPRAERSRLEISNVRVGDTPVTPAVTETIARISLPAPLIPGATTTIALDFEHEIRRRLGRAGYRGSHYDMAQWYPKVAVYDERGHDSAPWRAGEFYGEFGTFDVHITLPDNYVVAATGVVQEGDPGWTLNATDQTGPKPDGATSKTVHFHAENVHDFAWCADPTFVVESTTWNGIDVRSFYRKHNASSWADTTLAHGIRVLEWLTDKVGPYAYPQLSIVDALNLGGMEYPMLVMDGPADESLVFHEVGHIYFYGILGNDEVDEAWLDEGFTTFQAHWFKHDRYGRYGPAGDHSFYSFVAPQPTVWERLRNHVFWLDRRGYGERVATPADEFENSYYNNVYRKAALMLRALQYVVGEDVFERILQEYYSRWQLKHVNEERFVTVAEEVSGMDLGIFFEQWLHTRKTCDYRLDKVTSRPATDGNGYDVGVVVKREGEMIMPITLHFTLDDGSVVKHRVDGRLRTIKESFRLPGEPRHTAINPDNEIADIDLADNDSSGLPDLQIDWPNYHYYPENAYQLRYRPGAWYNDVDGLKAGLLLRGSYYNWARRLRLGVYYGFESDRLDFTASYDRPFQQFGSNAVFHISSYKMEGRRDFTTRVRFSRRKNLVEPPTQNFTLGFNYHELTNASYLNSPEIYDTTRADIAPYIGYSIDPQFDFMATRFAAGLRFGREWFSGKSKYERLSSEVVIKTRQALFPLYLNARGFLGLVGGEVPTEQKFSLAGAGPLGAEQRYWLRAPGATWDDLNYHEPGHGNLRGYQAGTFGVNKLASLNTELGASIPLLWLRPILSPILGSPRVYGFYDIGRAFDGSNPIGSSARVQNLVDGGILDETLMDAGVGFIVHRNFPFYNLTLRVDLPFWVSNPELNGEDEETRRRYVISLRSSF